MDTFLVFKWLDPQYVANSKEVSNTFFRTALKVVACEEGLPGLPSLKWWYSMILPYMPIPLRPDRFPAKARPQDALMQRIRRDNSPPTELLTSYPVLPIPNSQQSPQPAPFLPSSATNIFRCSGQPSQPSVSPTAAWSSRISRLLRRKRPSLRTDCTKVCREQLRLISSAETSSRIWCLSLETMAWQRQLDDKVPWSHLQPPVG